MPIRGGDVLKIYLAKHGIKNSTYPAVTSSFFVESIFDISAGLLVMTFALTRGVLPSPPELPNLPAFDLAFWADHFKFALFVITVGVLALLVLFARAVGAGGRVLAPRAAGSRDRDRAAALPAPGRLAGRRWPGCCASSASSSSSRRSTSAARSENALLVMSVQALSTLTPFTPGGAGAQQALLVFVFRDIAPKGVVLAYSVGQQVALAAFNFRSG